MVGEIMADDGNDKMGPLSAALIGIGGMVGGGIFAVLGTAVALAGGGTPLAFALAGVVALLTCYAYVKLSCQFPEAGGTALFLDQAFGANLFTGGLNLTLWLSYLVTIALYASAFASYGMTFFSSQAGWLEHVLISVAILLPTAINLLNASIVSKSESYIVIGKLILLGVVIAAGMFHLDATRLEPASWKAPGALVVGGMVIFVAYEGFELIANAAGDVREPRKNLPRAFFGCVAFVVLLYVLVAVVTVGGVPAETIQQEKDYALAAAARPSLGQAGFTLVSVSALMATFSAINATIYGNARLGYSLAVDGELPEELEKNAWNRPLPGVIATAAIALALANFIDLRSIAILGSAGFLVIFAAVCAAAFKLSAKIGARKWLCAAGCAACLVALVALLYHTATDNPPALAIFGGLLVAAYGFEWLYPKLSGRPKRQASEG
ncbi:APC family permease [Haloferula sargassicola]|uniref:Inner membrane transport protein YbaT n=1 Tax=Haloferula sargassicola TaxID=490096 RepID=A0ABP9UMV5_9BACT